MKYDEKRVREGLQAIINAEIIEEASPAIEGYLEAIKLKAMGFRDFIDLLLFETAKTNQLALLTRDEVVMAFVEEKVKGKKWILLEQEFKNM